MYTLEIILFILVVSAIHGIYINRIEKEIIHNISDVANWTLRPTKECYGMPSGHAETIVMSMFLCSYFGYIPIWLCIIIILAVTSQRIISRRHTICQVIVGSILGIIYGVIYIITWSINPILSLLFPCLIGILYQFINMKRINVV